MMHLVFEPLHIVVAIPATHYTDPDALSRMLYMPVLFCTLDQTCAPSLMCVPVCIAIEGPLVYGHRAGRRINQWRPEVNLMITCNKVCSLHLTIRSSA